ncbi:KN motif and ankyrin repeat domain-containing protein 2 isoform X1 [Antechinus flavipes]|uniref:KN motif and ankyrin repeat domain-containing protein 2 isoform X1 n=1 Tax=Antechinus flavipes TaxID=38775 RepID=UPI0022355E40|nr:KN motif and ankyrin repeat domain-containing protein 2 isoform X1 [Antechinus flavipes]XP_051827523.1 KN motif and ankyrin repeat domain-containing protein 2 isoform X1 [Antechinus flavipes]
MAQILHMEAAFPGKHGPTSPTTFPGKDPEPPYSVETPYGYRLDLDFLKYVDDIEKGHTMKRVAVHRRPRLGSLPRGTGSWWTSTESLCSNASVDSRHSAYSYCGRGFYPQYGALETRGGFNPRVERTLLDARRKLEDQAGGEYSRPQAGGLGSLTPSAAGSTGSLAGAGLPPRLLSTHNGGTPLSTSGLSTPVSPTPGHLQHVREQMAAALRKLRHLEEQVKLIPILQVKVSVLQEEKRQLSVQLKSQKFLGHPGARAGVGGHGRGELHLDLPDPADPFSDLDVDGEKKESRSVGVGPEDASSQRSVGTWVRERDLGAPEGQAALNAKIAVLETQLKKALHELQLAQGQQASAPNLTPAPGLTQEGPELPEGTGAPSGQYPPSDSRTWPPPDGPIRVDTVKVVQVQGEPKIAASTATGTPAQRAQSLEPSGPGGLRALVTRSPEGNTWKQPSAAAHCTREVVETTFPGPVIPVVPASLTPSTFHVAKKISITSEPYRVEEKEQETAPSLGPGCNGLAAPFRGLIKPSEIPPVPTATLPTQALGEPRTVSTTHSFSREQSGNVTLCGKEEAEEDSAALLQAGIKSIMKRKETSTDPVSNRKNLQFIGVNGGYESTSSEDSSTAENFSDNESTESEYHEANEGLPGTTDGGRPRGLGSVAEPIWGGKAGTVQRKEPVAEAVPSPKADDEIRLELSSELISACLTLQKYLENPDALTEKEMKAAYSTVLQDWLRLSCHKDAHPEVVRRHMVTFRAMSPQLLQFIVNMADGNGNTALHYTVSHSNFPVVKQLLDTGLCNVDKQNRAGYTAIMLTALAAFRAEGDMDTILQLLRLGDVNFKASQAGQTALMLAVSHGRIDMVRALLACAADVNLQDNDGSTALMCACEHGHVEIARLLLAVPACNVALTDHDGSTALSIALEAGQNDIAEMLYTHMHLAKSSGAPKQTTIKSAAVSSSNTQK